MKMINLKILISFIILIKLTNCIDVSLLCDQSHCAGLLEKEPCKPVDEDCRKNGRLFDYPRECVCGCEYCMKYLEAGQPCTIGQPGQPNPKALCGSGLGCVNKTDGTYECERLNTICHQEQDDFEEHNKNGTLGHLMMEPSCDERGDYGSAKCIPGSICFCVNIKGERIFGDAIYDSENVRLNMNCECSRAAWKASNIKLGQDMIFSHCLTNGSYDPLQCIDNTCTCIDDEITPSSARVHVAQLDEKSPSCFSNKLGHTKGKYMRECEIERANLLARQRDAAKSGATAVINDLPNCGLDGKYERLQRRGDLLVCTDQEGNQIEKFQFDRYSIKSSDMTCNCARTKYLLEKAIETSPGLQPMIPRCCENGNYRPWQCHRGFCYCVDPNGLQIGKEVIESKQETLECYHTNEEDPCKLKEN